jgi:hypothetical protein
MNIAYMNVMSHFKMNEHLMQQQSQAYADQFLTTTNQACPSTSINIDYMASTHPYSNNDEQDAQTATAFGHGWEKLEDAQNVIANVQHAFDMDSDVDLALAIGCDVGPESAVLTQRTALLHEQQPHSPTQMSVTPPLVNASVPDQYTDAQTIAFLLQKQLDEIDKEIRLIKEEKQNAQMRTEEIGLRVGWADLANNNNNNNDDPIVQIQYMSNSIKSTTSSGRSTPQRQPHPTMATITHTKPISGAMFNRHAFDVNNTSKLGAENSGDFTTTNASQSILATYPSWNTSTNGDQQQHHYQHKSHIADDLTRYNASNSPLSSNHSSDDSLNRFINGRQLNSHQDNLNKKKLLKKPFFRLFSSQRKKAAHKELSKSVCLQLVYIIWLWHIPT